jgi:hypothetical protein
VTDSPPTPFDDEGRLRVQCLYCAEGIAYEGIDPCAVVLVMNWGYEDEREQQFFAHAECFRKSAGGGYMESLDENFDLG